MKNQRGFTLVEFIIAVGIIGITVAICMLEYAERQKRAPFKTFQHHFGINPESFGATPENHAPSDPTFASKRELVQAYIDIHLGDICTYPFDLPTAHTEETAGLDSRELMRLAEEYQRIQRARDKVDRRCAEAISIAKEFGFDATSPH